MQITFRIDIPDSLPDIAEKELCEGFREAGVYLEIKRRPSMLMASLEDYLPAAISVLIFKPFFDAFLKKAGEDAYLAFKKGLSNAYSMGRKIKIQIFASAPGKIGTSTHSRAFAIYYATPSGKRIKFLFTAECTEGEAEEQIESMLAYLKVDSSEPHQNGSKLGASSGLMLMYFDADEKVWKKKAKRV